MEFIIVLIAAYLAYRFFFGGMIFKSHVASGVQSLLRQVSRSGVSRFRGDIDAAGREYAESLCIARPEFLKGNDGPRPHRAAAVVGALAMAADSLAMSKDENALPVTYALGKALMDISQNGGGLALTARDHGMIAFAMEVYKERAKDLM